MEEQGRALCGHRAAQSFGTEAWCAFRDRILSRSSRINSPLSDSGFHGISQGRLGRTCVQSAPKFSAFSVTATL